MVSERFVGFIGVHPKDFEETKMKALNVLKQISSNKPLLVDDSIRPAKISDSGGKPDFSILPFDEELKDFLKSMPQDREKGKYKVKEIGLKAITKGNKSRVSFSFKFIDPHSGECRMATTENHDLNQEQFNELTKYLNYYFNDLVWIRVRTK